MLKDHREKTQHRSSSPLKLLCQFRKNMGYFRALLEKVTMHDDSWSYFFECVRKQRRETRTFILLKYR